MRGEKARPVSSQIQALKEKLRAAIYRGEFPVGARIIEEDLRLESGVSLRAIRQALADLAKEGLVHRKRHAGTFIAQTVSLPASGPLRKVHSVGVLSSLSERGLNQNAYSSHVLSGVRSALAPPAAVSFFVNPDDGKRSLDDTPDFSSSMALEAIQGILAIETSSAQKLNEWTRAFGPVIALDFYAPDPLFDVVTLDHQEAGFQAASHLLALGHRRIAFVGEKVLKQSSDPTWQDRLVGYLRAMLAANINPSGEWILETRRSAGEMARRLPDFHRAIRPTAYVLSSTNMFEAAKGTLESVEVSCPKDVSIACADGLLPVSKIQSVSCVRPRFLDLGQAAVKLLASRLTCRSMPPVRVTLPIVFSPGASCRPLNA